MTTHNKWIAVWPDGERTEAGSPTELLVRIASFQWPRPDGSTYTPQQLKDELSNRGKLAYGKFIHPHQPDESFVRELHRIGMFELSVDGEKLDRQVSK